MNHIVFVVGNYKNGGVPMRSTNLANAFAEKGYCCTILATGEIGNDIFFKIISTSKPSSKIFLNCFCNTKFISTKLL